MKYIRTKDGVYKVTYNGLGYKEAKSQTMLMLVEHKNEKGKIEYEEITTHKELAMGKNRFKEHIIKQANSIEELCDFIAIVSENQIYDVETNIRLYFKYEYDQVLPEAKSEYPEEHWNMYLGILTDKGLIYVASMNDKGELELL